MKQNGMTQEKREEEDMIPLSPIHETDSDETKLFKFKKTYEYIKEMRLAHVAPVDTLGCKNVPMDRNTKGYRFQVLISLVLSAQTKDQITHAAMDRLREHGCTAQNLLDDEKTPVSTLEKLIYPVGFYKRKAQYIKKICKILVEQYNAGDIPDNIEDLLKLPGVGPKMAYLCMSGAWNNVVGIGVDTHVHRISNRLGWTKTNSPEGTRKALEEFVPRELWDPLNVMLVGFGQTICRPVSPSCANCKLLKARLCSYGIENWDAKKGKSSSPKTGKNQAKKRKKRTSKYESEEEGESSFKEENEIIFQEEGFDTYTVPEENTLPSDNIDMEDMFIGRRITRSLTRKQRKREQH